MTTLIDYALMSGGAYVSTRPEINRIKELRGRYPLIETAKKGSVPFILFTP